MANPAQLVQTISDVTGVPLATVIDIDRRLVKAGLRTKGGRGLHAARMKPIDAARLLTGILASPQANEAADAVARYMQTRADKVSSSEGLFAAVRLEGLGALPPRHGFVEALAVLIACASTGALAKLMAEHKRWQPRIEVFAFTRATRGRIRIAGMPNGLTASVEYVLTGSHRAALSGDLEQSRRITERTILPVAELLIMEGQS